MKQGVTGEHSEVLYKYCRINAPSGGTLDGRAVGGDDKQEAWEMEYMYIVRVA